MNAKMSEYGDAVMLLQHIGARYIAYLALVQSDGQDSAEAENDVCKSVVPGLYEHWKSAVDDPKFYIVHGVGIEQDVHRPLVAYTALYLPHYGKLAFRHLLDKRSGFLSPIDREEYCGPRFRLVCRLSRREIDILLQYVGELVVLKTPSSVLLHAGRLLKKELPIF